MDSEQDGAVDAPVNGTEASAGVVETDATAGATEAGAGRFALLGAAFTKVKGADHSKFVAGLLIGGLGTFSALSVSGSSTDVISAPIAAQLAQLRSEVTALKGGEPAAGQTPGEKVTAQRESPTTDHAASGSKSADAPHWTYAEAPNWGELADSYLACAEGKEQSPIALETGDVKRFAGETEFSYEAHSISVVDNGHTIQVNAEGAGAMKTDGKTYRLVQFHVHLPSEHTLDGKRFPLELHLVHKNAENKLAVLGVMVEEGAALDGFDAILEAIGAPNVEQAVKGAFDPATLLPKRRDLFKYEGSLTTPPCSEGVAWHVMTEPITMSKAQIETLKSHLHEANSRPLQPANGRTPHVEIDLAG